MLTTTSSDCKQFPNQTVIFGEVLESAEGTAEFLVLAFMQSTFPQITHNAYGFRRRRATQYIKKIAETQDQFFF